MVCLALHFPPFTAHILVLQGVPALFRWLSKKYPKIGPSTQPFIYRHT